jgi:hypothetical protein
MSTNVFFCIKALNSNVKQYESIYNYLRFSNTRGDKESDEDEEV